MPLDQIGSDPQLLSAGGNIANDLQKQRAEKQQANADAIQNAQKLPQEMALKQQESDLQKITITPQLAKGAAQATGDDSWNRAVGTKMDARIYSSLLTLGSQNAYHKSLLEDHDKLESMKEEAKKREQENKDKDASDAAAKKAKDATDMEEKKHGHKMSEIDESGKFKNKGGGRGSGASQDPKDKEFLKTYRGYGNDLKGFNSTLLAQMAKSDPTKAKELQDKQIFLQKNKQRFDQLQGMSPDNAQPSPQDQAGENAKAIDWLKQKYPKLTNPNEHDIEWALTQMSKK